MLAWRYWVWWLLIFPVFSLSAQPPLVVGAATVTLPIENTLIFFDSTGCLTDSVVTNPRYLTHFQPHEGSDFRLGKLGEKNAWVVFSVKNASPKSQKMILEMPLTRLAFGSCAIFEATPNGLYRRTQQIGRHWQDNIRPFIHSYQAAIELPAASEQKIYLKFIDGKFRTLDLSLRLSTPAHFERTYTSSLMFITAWLSALFLLLAISAVSFIFNQKKIFLFFKLYLLNVLLVVMRDYNIGGEIIPGMDWTIAYFLLSANGFFIKNFLDLDAIRHKNWNKWLSIASWANAVLLFVFLLLYSTVSWTLTQAYAELYAYFALVFFLFMIATLFRFAKEKRAARITLFGNLLLTFGGLAVCLEGAELIEHQNWMPNIFLYSLVWQSFIYVIFVARNYRQTERKAIESQLQLQLQDLQKQRELLEKERQVRTDVAMDLHDEVGSTLSSIALYSKAAKNLIGHQNPTDDDDLEALLERISAHSQSSILRMKSVVWLTDPNHDHLPSLLQALTELTTQTASVGQLDAHVTCQPDPLPMLLLSPMIRKNLYLIVREAVHNTLKHAHATQLQLDLRLAPTYDNHREFCITITDNGVGFDLYNQTSNGNGISNFRRRADLIGAAFQLESRPQRGTTVRFTLHLEQAPAA